MQHRSRAAQTIEADILRAAMLPNVNKPRNNSHFHNTTNEPLKFENVELIYIFEFRLFYQVEWNA
jgi:hypothetical protein